MPRFRKRPVEIEAFQLLIGAPMPEWFTAALEAKTVEPLPPAQLGDLNWGSDGLVVHTLEGQMSADIGDWIIKGVEGELYPCKDSIFRVSYEAVEHASSCAVHNEPALPAGPCDCGGVDG
jgi:hypothetical protein